MIDLVVASRNRDKVREIKELLKDLPVNVIGVSEFKDIPEIVEDGSTFEENAIKKAKTVAQLTGKLTIADDSGLEVDVLKGKPGIFSARFAGGHATDRENNQKLLELMKDIPWDRRTAQFRCVIALATPEGEVYTVEGVCRGIIADKEMGTSGFGYDPLFIYPDYNKTFAQMSMDLKNRISHRGKALQKMRLLLEKKFLR